MKFDFDDILLTPAVVSSINSRKEVNPYDENGFLPIMTAPMDTVVDEKNSRLFWEKNKINVVLPRGANSPDYSVNKFCWFSYGLNEFKSLFIEKEMNFDVPVYALIDVANGHMVQLFELIETAKKLYGDKIVLMVGNIANPKTFEALSRLKVDYVRVGIGGGQGCLTSVQTGVGYPMASLIKECYGLKEYNHSTTKIVADGGFKKFADINKALALGADYVMLGSMLNKCLESSGDLYKNYEETGMTPMRSFHQVDGLQQERYIEDVKNGRLFKSYRGMSTKEVQKAWGRTELKTAEGISKLNKVEYTVGGFVSNLEDYLRSAMSYTGSSTLEEFRQSLFCQITEFAFNRFNK